MKHSIGLYVHIPFCQHKCSYCDFYSVVSLEAMERFTEAIVSEIRLWAHQERLDATVETIFWGGGTPSLLECRQAEQIASVLRSVFSLAPNYEWTIEANPGTITLEKLRFYRELGINRISFGVQSFDHHELEFLERLHSAQQAEEAVELARRAGFDNINLDVIYALPAQDLETYQRTLERVCTLTPEHISAYSLVYEHGTPLYRQLQRGAIIPLDEDQEAAFYSMTVEFLAQRGYRQYEVSNFARPGRQCRHNLLYWRRGQYVGFGPSAHSHVDNVRWSNVRSLQRYFDAIERGSLPIMGREQLTIEQQRAETIFLGLRADGIELDAFARAYGIWLDRGMLGELLTEWQQNGWACLDRGTLRLTSRGYALCDALTLQLLDALERAQSASGSFVDCNV
ncbi:MAG: radical SAM family heme chaperone HemW [Chlorobiota bacterium]|nr:MAG: radical SAM family heme chaperone HemW [Chlorobiota bacterium]